MALQDLRKMLMWLGQNVRLTPLAYHLYNIYVESEIWVYSNAAVCLCICTVYG